VAAPAYVSIHTESRARRSTALRSELRPLESGCELTFTTHFAEVGKAARDAAGWHVCLDLLEEQLAGNKPDGTSEQRWCPLSEHYRAEFPPEASTIGPPDWHPESKGEAWTRDLAREQSLTVRRMYDATPDAVYRAWTDPAAMRRWMGANVEADVRPGGVYRRQNEYDGTTYVHAGEYVSREPAMRIVQTFRVETTQPNPFHDEIVEARIRAHPLMSSQL
jgi:hypothetical protein